MMSIHFYYQKKDRFEARLAEEIDKMQCNYCARTLVFVEGKYRCPCCSVWVEKTAKGYAVCYLGWK
ncbi:hypothetical protein UFOVP82_45 [uncultured Caudovirales phage]|uniref:Uncharacterized protein n=1 Tax=uncultured Caudovirales phage TaxID=2100421 RepID=A0A6J5KNF0_9CAUD|nr:hypothetical protein UFOVP18_43 [uncultured Caudovirales phage]CAB4127023.1 hypothetical protein UFOVP82_45 [uncultured Caudovirales phage]CAB4132576.1 hypothetical protein UFOVP258_36 [uncultured Caudovirales phage]CAB4146480.1 hypothetical protein UFOVP502_28 [uncultured Caudovirales phage]